MHARTPTHVPQVNTQVNTLVNTLVNTQVNRVLAFETAPRSLAALQASVAYHGWDVSSRVLVLPQPLGNSSEELCLQRRFPGTNIDEQRGYSRPSQLADIQKLPECHSGGQRRVAAEAMGDAARPHVVRINANGFEPQIVLGMLPMLMVGLILVYLAADRPFLDLWCLVVCGVCTPRVAPHASYTAGHGRRHVLQAEAPARADADLAAGVDGGRRAWFGGPHAGRAAGRRVLYVCPCGARGGRGTRQLSCRGRPDGGAVWVRHANCVMQC